MNHMENNFDEGQERDHCTQCPNHCPVNDLRCERGKASFSQEGENKEGQFGYTHEHGYGSDERNYSYGHRRGDDWAGYGYHQDWNEYKNAYDHDGKMDWGCGEEDKLTMLLVQCGHQLYHSLGKEHGKGIDYNVLNQEEQEQLAVYLEKLLESGK